MRRLPDLESVLCVPPELASGGASRVVVLLTNLRLSGAKVGELAVVGAIGAVALEVAEGPAGPAPLPGHVVGWPSKGSTRSTDAELDVLVGIGEVGRLLDGGRDEAGAGIVDHADEDVDCVAFEGLGASIGMRKVGVVAIDESGGSWGGREC